MQLSRAGPRGRVQRRSPTARTYHQEQRAPVAAPACALRSPAPRSAASPPRDIYFPASMYPPDYSRSPPSSDAPAQLLPLNRQSLSIQLFHILVTLFVIQGERDVAHRHQRAGVIRTLHPPPRRHDVAKQNLRLCLYLVLPGPQRARPGLLPVCSPSLRT